MCKQGKNVQEGSILRLRLCWTVSGQLVKGRYQRSTSLEISRLVFNKWLRWTNVIFGLRGERHGWVEGRAANYFGFVVFYRCLMLILAWKFVSVCAVLATTSKHALEFQSLRSWWTIFNSFSPPSKCTPKFHWKNPPPSTTLPATV